MQNCNCLAGHIFTYLWERNKIKTLKRELLIKEIIEEFSILKNKIELLSASNLNDLNIIYEYHFGEILNIIYGYKLSSSNRDKGNATAIDLQDESNRVAVQVTSSSHKRKVQETLSAFFSSALDEKYDVLLILILGKKQNKYPGLVIDENFYFDAEEHILDFTTLSRTLATLPSSKIEKVRNIMKEDRASPTKHANSVKEFRKNKALKKKLEDLIHKNLTREDLEFYFYAPYRKFIYDSLIIRSVSDRSYPNSTEDWKGPLPPWFKAQIHNLYNYGLEMIPMFYEKVVVNSEGKWNYLGKREEKDIVGLHVHRTNVVQRIPFDAMIELDMETDPYYGYPSLYLDYANLKGVEELPILLGYYKSEQEYRVAHYFELADRDETL